MYNITVNDAVQFIRKHDTKDKAFPSKEWSNNQLALEIMSAIEDNSLTFTLDSEGELDGICICRRNDFHEIMYVVGIIGNIESMWKMLGHFKLWFPGWRLQARRNSTVRLYNTDKLINTLRKFQQKHEIISR